MWVNQKCTSYWGNILMVDKDNQLPSTHLHLRREAHPAWYILASYPQTLAECHWEVFCVAPYSGLLVFGQLWLGAIYNFLKRWTVVTDPNGTGMFLCYGFLVCPYACSNWMTRCYIQHRHRPESNVGSANVGPMSRRPFRRWANVGRTYIAVWAYTNLCVLEVP